MSIIQLAFDSQHPYQSEIKPKPFDLSCPVCKSNLELDQQGNLVCGQCKEELHFESEKQEKQLQARAYFEKALSLPEAERKELLEKALELFDSLEHKELEDLEAQAFLYEALALSTRNVEKRLSYYQKAVSALEEARLVHSSPALLYYLADLHESIGYNRYLIDDNKAMTAYKAAESLIAPLYRKAKKHKKLVYGRLFETILQEEIYLERHKDHPRKAMALYQKLFTLIRQQQKELPDQYEWAEEVLRNYPDAVELHYELYEPKKARALAAEVIEICQKRFETRADEESFETLFHVLVHLNLKAAKYNEREQAVKLFALTEDLIAQGEKRRFDFCQSKLLEKDLVLTSILKAKWNHVHGRTNEAIDELKEQMNILESRYKTEKTEDEELLYNWGQLLELLYFLLDPEKHKEERVALLEKQFELENWKIPDVDYLTTEYLEAQKGKLGVLYKLLDIYHSDQNERKELETLERMMELFSANPESLEFRVKEVRGAVKRAAKLAEKLDEPQKALIYNKKLEQLQDLDEEDYV